MEMTTVVTSFAAATGGFAPRPAAPAFDAIKGSGAPAGLRDVIRGRSLGYGRHGATATELDFDPGVLTV